MPFPSSWYPREVLVRDQLYRVKFVKVVMGRKDWVGYCCAETQTIYLMKGMQPERRFTVFCHELGHAIENEWGVELHHQTLSWLDFYLAKILRANTSGVAIGRPPASPRRARGTKKQARAKQSKAR